MTPSYEVENISILSNVRTICLKSFNCVQTKGSRQNEVKASGGYSKYTRLKPTKQLSLKEKFL